LRSRFDQFQEARRFEIDAFKDQQGLAVRQRDQTRRQESAVKDRVAEINQQTREKNLLAVQSISDTAANLVEETAAKWIDDQGKLGVWEGFQEDFRLTPDGKEVYKQAEGLVRTSAAKEGEANAELAKENLRQAEDQRLSSPRINGFRAHGRAVGRAQKAAGIWDAAMRTYMSSTDPLIPDPLDPDTLISPRELAARGPAGIEAALASGTKQLFEQMGLDTIHPMVLSEHLRPQVININGNIGANVAARNRENDLSDERFEIGNTMVQASKGLDLADSTKVTEFANYYIDRFRATGMDRATANEVAMTMLVAFGVSTKQPEFLNALAAADVSTETAGLGTFEDRFPDLFDGAFSKLGSELEEADRLMRQALDDQVAIRKIQRQDALVAAGTDVEQIERENKEYREFLRQAAANGSQSAMREYMNEVAQPLSATDQAYPALVRAMQSDGPKPTPAQLDEMVARGIIDPGQRAALNALRPPDVAGDIMDGVDSVISANSRNIIKRNADAAKVPGGYAGTAELGPAMANAHSQETRLQLRDWIQERINAGQTPTVNAINGAALTIAQNIAKNEQFNFRMNEGRVEAVAPLLSQEFRAPILPNAAGGASQDLTREAPFVIRGQARTDAFTLTGPELEANQKALQEGQPPTPRALQVIAYTGQSQSELVQQQSNLQQGPGSFDASTTPQAQRQQEQFQLAPAEASIVNHAGTPPPRISRGYARLQRQRQLNAMRGEANAARAEWARTGNLVGFGMVGDGSGGGGQVSSMALRPVLDLIAGGEAGSQGYDAVNRGGADDTKGGIKSLVGKSFADLTVGEIKQLQANGTIRAVGRYQFIPSTFQAALRTAGIGDNEKFTPEVQDRLAASWILNGPRKTLSAYIRGESNDIDRAMDEAATEWAALSDSRGRGVHNAVGGNRNNVSSGSVRQALEAARRDYQLSRSTAAASTSQTSFAGNATLQRLGGRIAYSAERHSDGSVKKGLCVTNVLNTLRANGIPNPDATGLDMGNNPRGAAVQFVNNLGWKPLNIPGSTPITLNSPGYGRATVNQMSIQQYQQAVSRGQVPSGALVFQTRHNSWNGTAHNSSGYDIAIARDNGTRLFNGEYMPSEIYPSGTRHVFVLVPSR
jgi:hypothetical protein